MNASEAKLELALIEADISEQNKIDFITYLTNSGIPQEVVQRIAQLWEKTKKIGQEVIEIGKIIIYKIWEFLKENPNLAAGMALGAAISTLIPFVGALLAPLAVAVGALLGVRLDNYEKGIPFADNAVGIAHEAVQLARKFFDLFVEIVDAVQMYWVSKDA